MKWENNLISIKNHSKSGGCPYCKSQNTDYKYVRLTQYGERGFLDVWCNDCGERMQFTCSKVPDGEKTVENAEIATAK